MGTLAARFIGILVLLQVLLVAPIAVSQEQAPDFNKQLKSMERTIGQVEARIQSGRSGSLEDRDLRAQLQDIVKTAVAARDSAIAQAKQIQGLIQALGPLPNGENAKAEAKAIQDQRKKLNDDLAIHEGRAKQADLIIAKADQVLADIGKRSRERLKATLVERTVTPLSYKAWVIAGPEALRLFNATFVDVPKVWWNGIQNNPAEQETLLRNLIASLVAAVAAWLFGKWLRSRYGRVPGVDSPSHARRIFAGLVEGGGKALAPVVFVLLVGSLAAEGGSFEGTTATVARAVESSLVLFLLSYALINAALTPQRQQWRILDFGERASRLLVLRLKVTLVVFLVFDGIYRAISWATPSAELESIWTFVSILALTPLIILLLDSRIWVAFAADTSSAPESDKAGSRFQGSRALLTVGLVTLPALAAFGYTGLASYLMRAVILTGLTLGGLGLLRIVCRGGLAAAFDPYLATGRRVRGMFSMDQRDVNQALFWLHVLIDLSLLVAALLVLLPIWGLGAEETAASAAKIFRGVKIGAYTISVMDILIALCLFISIIFLTHLAQKGLVRHVLPNLTQDKGVRDALKTGVGYIGFIIAVLVAVSTTGMDLTNLALIAGALSVGLGFGLQNVVNNFVSGLILLAERPIKPGDWVVIGGHEGKVKKVSVRSTEIETFQRASVIIPNADLISTPVINWTHKNIFGRVEILVGVAYGTDPRAVESILLECVKAHPNVLGYPAPYVLFMDFAESSLNFEVRAYLADVEKRLLTASDLRYSIHDALKEKGIEIPFPQRVVHLSQGGVLPGGSGGRNR